MYQGSKGKSIASTESIGYGLRGRRFIMDEEENSEAKGFSKSQRGWKTFLLASLPAKPCRSKRPRHPTKRVNREVQVFAILLRIQILWLNIRSASSSTISLQI